MSLAQRTVLFTIAGILGGLLIWYSLDRTMLLFVLAGRLHPGSHPLSTASIAGAVAGGILGFLLGVADALTLDHLFKRFQSFALFLLAGVVGGIAALAISPIIPTAPMPVLASHPPVRFLTQFDLPTTVWQIISPSLAWGVLSMALGVVPGIVRRSFRLSWQGGAGALVAAVFAAAMMEGAKLQPESARISPSLVFQASTYAAAGGVLAFGQSILPMLLRRATLTIIDGIGKGREYLISKPLTRLGSGPVCDVVVNVAKGNFVVATIEESAAGYRLSPSKEAVDAAWEDRVAPRKPTLLNDADLVEIGQCKVRFSMLVDGQPSAQVSDKPQIESSVADVTAPMNIVPVATQPAVSDQRGAFSANELKPGIAARLICISGPAAGKQFTIPPGMDVTLGRGSDQDVSIPDDVSASRAHAVIEVQEGRHVVIDNNSANGTLLNGDPVTSRPRRLYPGDFILIGQTELVYEVDPPPAGDHGHS